MAATQQPRNLTRISEIVQVAVRHGFGYVFDRGRLRELLPWPARTGEGEAVPAGSRGVRLRQMLDELGPSFVKFGQLLSTRPDVVPADILVELRQLQDQAAPVPFEEIEKVIVAELGAPLEQIFAQFERTPVAAASIGQVHYATLPTGDRVAVKVQRPTAEAQVEADIALLYQLARLVKEHVRRLDFIDSVALVDEFARSIRSELDYRGEARNCQLFRAAFADDERVLVPNVHWTFSTQRVLTLERVDGVLLKDAGASLDPAGRKRLAYQVAELWLEMIFRHGHFHGDPHPANIMVLADGRIGLVDFGVAGRLSKEDMRRLILLFLDGVHGNVDALPRRLADLGVRYPRANEDGVKADIEALWYRYAGASLAEIDPNELLRELLGMIHRQQLELPSRFLLLDRAMITLGAVGQELYPEFNVFELARPYAQELTIDQYSPAALFRRARGEVGAGAQAMLDIPRDLAQLMERLLRSELEISVRHRGLEAPLRRLDTTANRLVLGMVLAGLLVGSAILAGVDKGPHVLGLQVAGLIGFLSAWIIGFVLLLAILRRGRL
jgi:ubiquinone biosynthesis protein